MSDFFSQLPAFPRSPLCSSGVSRAFPGPPGAAPRSLCLYTCPGESAEEVGLPHSPSDTRCLLSPGQHLEGASATKKPQWRRGGGCARADPVPTQPSVLLSDCTQDPSLFREGRGMYSTLRTWLGPAPRCFSCQWLAFSPVFWRGASAGSNTGFVVVACRAHTFTIPLWDGFSHTTCL